MRNKIHDRRLSLRRETVRRLASLGRRDLARVAGGTGDGGYDPETADTAWPHWTDSQTMGTTSRYC